MMIMLLLFRHGVVRYESVMKLREQLEQLEKMKGITQDEKGISQVCDSTIIIIV